ncbi:hypothetical protein [Sorangium sp. So ce426]|uniref:hypothetical protein n=1 Tax=Sorangium sp. So ce426 TaxID=3133312 RepID=UPI003F5BAF7A
MKTTTATPPRPEQRRLARCALGAAAAAALGWPVMTSSPSDAPSQRGASAEAVDPVADAAPGYAVEDFNYPQAGKILAEQGITLERGDGRVVLADCASQTGLLEVFARKRKHSICFRVTGNSGYLSLEIPAVYAIRGNDYTIQVDIAVDNEVRSYEIQKNEWLPVGESTGETKEVTLVEIRTSK